MNQLSNYAIKKGANIAAKKFMNKNFDANKGRDPAGQWDPYFEYREVKPGKHGKPAKMRKFKKQAPAYLSDHDALVLQDVRKWAYRMDVKLSFMGMRFGWGAILGAIPELGDILDILIQYYIYSKCKKVEGGLDRKTKAKMKMWIVSNGLIGLVPFVGDIIDASIKPNARNCRLLEEFLDKKYKPQHLVDEHRELQRQDPNYRPPAPATEYEDLSDDDGHHDHHCDDRRAIAHGPHSHSYDDRRGGRSTAYGQERGSGRRR